MLKVQEPFWNWASLLQLKVKKGCAQMQSKQMATIVLSPIGAIDYLFIREF
jgi:hypothetical protein